MTYLNIPSISSELIVAERDILARVALGGPIREVLHDIIVLVEKPAGGELLASILLTTEDGTRLVNGAGPSLPAEYNAAIEGIAVAHGIGSCGTAAYTGQIVVVSDIASNRLWADYRDLALAHDLRACWSMPIRAADGRVLGTFANYYREPKEPTQRDLEVIGMVTRTAAIAIERDQNEMARNRAEEQRLLLMRELNHRVKNVFALADSMLALSARTATDVEDYASEVRGRLRALGRAHELVQPAFGLNEAEQPAISLKQILSDILAPYAHKDNAEKIAVIGAEEIMVSAREIASVALILHELATNAAKYGALSAPEGRLLVTFIKTDVLRVIWSERATSAFEAPVETGFGSTLVTRTVKSLRGSLSYQWLDDGLDIEINLPLGV